MNSRVSREENIEKKVVHEFYSVLKFWGMNSRVLKRSEITPAEYYTYIECR